MDHTPKSVVYRHLLAFINISLISLQITLLTVLATYYIIHGHHSTIFAAYIYGILLWGKSYNVDKIAKLQKRAIRTISFSRPIAHTEPLFKTFNPLKFNDIYTLKLMNFFYKLSNDSLPAYLLRIKL